MKNHWIIISSAFFLLTFPAHSQDVLDTLKASKIVADPAIRIPESQTGHQRLIRNDFSRFTVFSAPDIMKTLQAMPGVSMGSDLSSGLYVRGGDGADNLLTLDGVPVYNMSHLFGLFSVIDPGIAERVDFYRSGFSASRGGATSSIIDVYARDGNPDSLRTELSIGIADSRFLIEGPVKKTRFILTGRVSPISLIVNPVLKLLSADGIDPSFFTDARMGYFEVDARVSRPLSAYTDIYMNALFNRDYRKTGETRADLENTDNIIWGNALAAIGVRHRGSDGSKTDASLYFTGTYSSVHSTFSSRQDSSYYYRKEGNASPLAEFGLRSDSYLQKRPDLYIRYGGKISYLQNQPHRIYHILETVKNSKTHKTRTIREENINTPLIYRCGNLSSYIDAGWTPSPLVTLQGGMRYSFFLSDGKGWHSLEPRLSMSYSPLQGFTLKTSYDRMGQPLHAISSSFNLSPATTMLPSTRKIRPVISDQISFGGEYRKKGVLLLSTELYYKRMTHLYEYGGEIMMFPPLDTWESCFVEGIGRSYGIENQISVKKGQLRFDAAYTLSWSERKFEDFYCSWYPDRFDNRHTIHLNLARERNGYDWHISWTYHSGNRTTLNSFYSIKIWKDSPQVSAVNYALAPNQFLFPAYHRLDAGINFHYKTARGISRTASFDFFNIYNRCNPISVRIINKSYRNRLSYRSLLPFIPSFRVGFEF